MKKKHIAIVLIISLVINLFLICMLNNDDKTCEFECQDNFKYGVNSEGNFYSEDINGKVIYMEEDIIVLNK